MATTITNTTTTSIHTTTTPAATSTITTASSMAPTTTALMQPTFVIEYFDKNRDQWSRWVERLEGAFTVFSILNDKIKLHWLLHYIGPETYNVVCDKFAPEKPNTKTYQEIVDALHDYYDPAPLEIVENFRFHLRKQQGGESVEEYMTALRRLSTYCNFGNYLQTALRNQFVFGLQNATIKNKLLSVKNLTLDVALSTARSMELSARGCAEIHANSSADARGSVNLLRQRSSSKNNNTSTKNNRNNSNSKNQNKLNMKGKQFCFRCGDETHKASSCSRINTICNYCNKKGHIAKVCFQAKAKQNRNEKHTNYIQGNDNDNSDFQYDELFNIVPIGLEDRSKFWYVAKVNDRNIKFEVDSGSPVTVMSMKDKRKHFKHLHIQRSNIELSTYCNSSLEIYGFIEVTVVHGSTSHTLKIYS